MPSSTTKAKREVAVAKAVQASARSKTPARRPPTTGSQKATTPKRALTPKRAATPKRATPKRGTPSKRQAAEAEVIVVSDDEAASTISPLVSPAKRVRTPSSKHRNNDEDCVGSLDAGSLDEVKDELELGRTTRLFAEGNSDADIDGSSGSSKDPTEEEYETLPALFATPQKPKNQKAFGTPGSIQCSPSVKNAYSIVRRCTGSLGGNGSGGAIYGELTTGSMQKVVDVMISHCGLGKDSIFIDVGAGLGKPNIHVAQYPGVAASYGIEHEEVRWQLSLHNLKHLLQAAEAEAQEIAGTAAAAVEAEAVEAAATAATAAAAAANRINHKIFFHYGDVTEARTLDPFTHVYMFDIGFPPALFYEIADRFNASHCPFLICYHGPKLIAERYGFDVSLLTQIQTSMHGSSEGHTAYFYERTKPHPARPARRPVDALFKQGLDLIGQSSVEKLHSWVKQKMDSHFTSPRPARQRRSTNLFNK